LEFFAQLETFLRGSCDIRRRDKARIHLTLLNAEGLWAAISPDNSGLSSDAAISRPLILPGEISFRSTRPTLPPPLDCHATLSTVFSGFAMGSSSTKLRLNSLEAKGCRLVGNVGQLHDHSINPKERIDDLR
jgi:hypothetical protein